ncbi:glycosyltransferase family 4 protein [Candidatus Acetothermia bacterium]|nr:glycosyltransferase family 4 protein [Candidatus Acetothermia bacterium]
MKVLMFGWEFPPYQAGGLATATLGLVKGLLRQGIEVTLVVPFPVGHSELIGLRLVSTATRVTQLLRTRRVTALLGPYMTAQEYTVTHAQMVQGAATTGKSVYGRNIFEEVERFASIAAGIAREEPHNVIHAHDWITYAAAIEAQKISGKPLVAHIHATEYDRSGDHPNPEIYRREREGMHAADIVIANSHALRRLVTRHYGLPSEKIEVVHWGIEEHRPEYHLEPPRPFKQDEPVVLFLGRVTRQKGPDYFIEMARKVADFVPDARFVMAGSGDMLPQIIERTAELGLTEKVHFAGAVQGADVFKMFRMADVCVMPSVSEPFGLVALESLKSGTPVIIPKESGVAEALRNVFKVDFWDIDEMTNKVVGILRHRELYEELRERSLEEVSSPKLGLDEPAKRVKEVYERAIEMANDRILQEVAS